MRGVEARRVCQCLWPVRQTQHPDMLHDLQTFASGHDWTLEGHLDILTHQLPAHDGISIASQIDARRGNAAESACH